MKTCNADADAKGLSGEGKGEDRKAFMKECLRETGQGRGRHLSAEQNGKLTRTPRPRIWPATNGRSLMKTCLSNQHHLYPAASRS